MRTKTEQEINIEISNIYDSFWKDIIEDKDGLIDIIQLKKELYDFHLLIENLPNLYTYITNNRISNPLTDINAIKSVYDEILESNIEEAIDDFLKCPSNENKILAVARKYKINNLLEDI